MNNFERPTPIYDEEVQGFVSGQQTIAPVVTVTPNDDSIDITYHTPTGDYLAGATYNNGEDSMGLPIRCVTNITGSAFTFYDSEEDTYNVYVVGMDNTLNLTAQFPNSEPCNWSYSGETGGTGEQDYEDDYTDNDYEDEGPDPSYDDEDDVDDDEGEEDTPEPPPCDCNAKDNDADSVGDDEDMEEDEGFDDGYDGDDDDEYDDDMGGGPGDGFDDEDGDGIDDDEEEEMYTSAMADPLPDTINPADVNATENLTGPNNGRIGTGVHQGQITQISNGTTNETYIWDGSNWKKVSSLDEATLNRLLDAWKANQASARTGIPVTITDPPRPTVPGRAGQVLTENGNVWWNVNGQWKRMSELTEAEFNAINARPLPITPPSPDFFTRPATSVGEVRVTPDGFHIWTGSRWLKRGEMKDLKPGEIASMRAEWDRLGIPRYAQSAWLELPQGTPLPAPALPPRPVAPTAPGKVAGEVAASGGENWMWTGRRWVNGDMISRPGGITLTEMEAIEAGWAASAAGATPPPPGGPPPGPGGPPSAPPPPRPPGTPGGPPSLPSPPSGSGGAVCPPGSPPGGGTPPPPGGPPPGPAACAEPPGGFRPLPPDFNGWTKADVERWMTTNRYSGPGLANNGGTVYYADVPPGTCGTTGCQKIVIRIDPPILFDDKTPAFVDRGPIGEMIRGLPGMTQAEAEKVLEANGFKKMQSGAWIKGGIQVPGAEKPCEVALKLTIGDGGIVRATTGASGTGTAYSTAIGFPSIARWPMLGNADEFPHIHYELVPADKITGINATTRMVEGEFFTKLPPGPGVVQPWEQPWALKLNSQLQILQEGTKWKTPDGKPDWAANHTRLGGPNPNTQIPEGAPGAGPWPRGPDLPGPSLPPPPPPPPGPGGGGVPRPGGGPRPLPLPPGSTIEIRPGGQGAICRVAPSAASDPMNRIYILMDGTTMTGRQIMEFRAWILRHGIGDTVTLASMEAKLNELGVRNIGPQVRAALNDMVGNVNARPGASLAVIGNPQAAANVAGDELLNFMRCATANGGHLTVEAMTRKVIQMGVPAERARSPQWQQQIERAVVDWNENIHRLDPAVQRAALREAVARGPRLIEFLPKTPGAISLGAMVVLDVTAGSFFRYRQAMQLAEGQAQRDAASRAIDRRAADGLNQALAEQAEYYYREDLARIDRDTCDDDEKLLKRIDAKIKYYRKLVADVIWTRQTWPMKLALEEDIKKLVEVYNQTRDQIAANRRLADQLNQFTGRPADQERDRLAPHQSRICSREGLGEYKDWIESRMLRLSMMRFTGRCAELANQLRQFYQTWKAWIEQQTQKFAEAAVNNIDYGPALAVARSELEHRMMNNQNVQDTERNFYMECLGGNGRPPQGTRVIPSSPEQVAALRALVAAKEAYLAQLQRELANPGRTPGVTPEWVRAEIARTEADLAKARADLQDAIDRLPQGAPPPGGQQIAPPVPPGQRPPDGGAVRPNAGPQPSRWMCLGDVSKGEGRCIETTDGRGPYTSLQQCMSYCSNRVQDYSQVPPPTPTPFPPRR